MLFYCLQKQEAEAKEQRFSAFDSLFLQANFLRYFPVPQHTLMTTLSDGHVLGGFLAVHDDKLFTGERVIRIWNCTNHESVTALTAGAHTNRITCLRFYDDNDGSKLYSAGIDRTIKVWNGSDDFSLLATLFGHQLTVTCLHVDADTGKLYSGSADRTVKVWRISDFSLITTLTRHTSGVVCIAIHDRKCYTGGDDSRVCVWDCVNDSLIATLRGHTSTVSCLSIHGDKLYSGSHDFTIRVWNCTDLTYIKELRGHSSGITCLAIYDDDAGDAKLYSGSYDHTIKVWNCSDYSLIATLDGHASILSGLKIHDGNLYSNADNIKVWSCSDDALIATLEEEHDEDVTCLEIHPSGKLYSSSEGQAIKVWKL